MMAIHLPGEMHGALCAVHLFWIMVDIVNPAKHSGQSLPVNHNVHTYVKN